MTSKISIKIHNQYGVNSIKGQDISKEETLELIGLARELIIQQAPVHLCASHYLEGESLPLDETVMPIVVATEKTTVTSVRPEPLKAKPISMKDDDQPIKLGATPNPDVKRIVPRTPTPPPVEEEPPVIEPNTVVFSTEGSPKGINTMADKLIGGFQEAVGIEVTATTTEFLTVDEQLAELNKDFYTTGVKHKVYAGEITPMYRVRWECPTCLDKGNHYSLENAKQMNCYGCQTSLLIEPAAGKFPERDEWGNFFVANKVNPRWQRA